MNIRIVQALFFILFAITTYSCAQENPTVIEDERFYIKTIDLKKENLKLYWKNDKNTILKTFENLKEHLDKKGDSLFYAMNAGMYLKHYSPQGLFIENNTVIKPLDTATTGYGNFYLQPNGVFCITNHNQAQVKTTQQVTDFNDIKYATQSGPMLVINGELHPAFNEGSNNIHIRNAVGILPDGRVLLVISKNKINFYDLATFFKDQGCKNALYLDGFVSRIYDLENHIEQMDGNFGVMIGVSN